MKPRLLPLYFDPGRDHDFDEKMDALKTLLADDIELLTPVALGSPMPESEAVVFPQMLGEAYRRLDDFQKIDRPILIVTSEFGTLSMWDWEIARYLREEGVETIAPTSLEQTKMLCRALKVKRELKGKKFLAYQDNPGEGMQAPIFKRFYWWEDECSRRIFEQFGITVEHRSLQELGERAKLISDARAEAAWKEKAGRVPLDTAVCGKAVLNAMKLYLAVKDDVAADPAVRAVGTNCLNESRFCDTTPCLAWNLLYEEDGLYWGCEGDTVTMLTMTLLQPILKAPIMMTNLYPYLLGQAALKHEKILDFPQVDSHYDDHILLVHCGYFGLFPTSFACHWKLCERVLEIVDPEATAVDAEYPLGPVTFAKIGPTMKMISVSEGDLVKYTQFPGSDSRNGGVVRVENGRRFVDRLVSHHYLLMTGAHAADIELVSRVLGLSVENI
ncbi:MAG: hypothetical protein PHE53_10850 [Thermoguttaceae bacterium]|nr:hypothetical protein [Thermoguttaceae bacterium]